MSVNSQESPRRKAVCFQANRQHHKRFEELYLKDKAEIWPGLSNVCHICSKVAVTVWCVPSWLDSGSGVPMSVSFQARTRRNTALGFTVPGFGVSVSDFCVFLAIF